MRRVSPLIAGLVALTALGAVAATRARLRIETKRTMEEIAHYLRNAGRAVNEPLVPDKADDRTGRLALQKALTLSLELLIDEFDHDCARLGHPSCRAYRGLEVRDAWGRPILFRSPGPIHTKGWDLISCGPDGNDDGGLGDDVVVGEDLSTIDRP